MEPLAPEEAEPLVELHCGGVGDFGFKCNLRGFSEQLAKQTG